MSTQARPWSVLMASASGLLVMGLGVTVTTGWIVRSAPLIQVLPHLPPMTRNAAACFVLCGAGLLCHALRAPRAITAVCGALVFTLAAGRLIEIAFRVNTGLNEILGPSYINVLLRRPGGMAPLTAACFALCALALLLAPQSPTRSSARAMGVLGAMTLAIAASALLGYWSPAVALMALHTAVGLLVLGAGMIALAWRVDGEAGATPDWLPVAVAAAIVISTVGVWRALVLGGHPALLATVLLFAGGLLAPVFGITIHLAQRATRQAATLHRSEAFLARAQYLSSTGSFAWRVDTDRLIVSGQLYEILGLRPGESVTRREIAARVHPDDASRVAEMFEGARQRAMALDGEFRIRLPDGSLRHLHMLAEPAGRADPVLEYIGAVQDVTLARLADQQLHELRAELAHASRVASLGALAASITHELSQPLAGIATNADTCLRMLGSEPPNVEGARSTARRSVRDANRATEVVTRLRALFSKRSTPREPVDLNLATTEVVALTRTELQKNRVLLTTELSDSLAPVMGDRVQVQQVILNLILNAVAAMAGIADRPRRMLIRTEPVGRERARLSVSDSGTGFDPADAGRLFEAFYTTKPGGMGIGLSVSRFIIESHGGQLTAELNEGPGATFAFTLACAAGTAASSSEANGRRVTT